MNGNHASGEKTCEQLPGRRVVLWRLVRPFASPSIGDDMLEKLLRDNVRGLRRRVLSIVTLGLFHGIWY